MDYKLAKRRYKEQRNHCSLGNKSGKLDALKTQVQMKLTFEEWADIWVTSGKWEERGIYKGSYCMMRKNDIGHYEKGNVFIGLHRENASDANKGRKHTDEHRRKNAEARIGIPRSEETRHKISQAQLGGKRSDETKARMRVAQLGKRVSDDTKAKLSALNKGKPMKRVKCDACGLETSPQNLSRHKRVCQQSAPLSSSS